MLCHNCDEEYGTLGSQSKQSYYDTSCVKYILNQHFAVDSGIITSPALASLIKLYGGIYVRRLTSSNPCKDTVSITRYGTEIPVDAFNHVLIKLNNDTNAIALVQALMIFHQNEVAVASPNMYRYQLRHPNDQEYRANPTRQKHLQMIGMPTVWNSEVGSPSIKVAVIDDGVDNRRIELGSGKVIVGWNYTENNTSIFNQSGHGTSVASIIGAKTNNSDIDKVAGIGGGWDWGNTPNEGLGTSIIGFRVVNPADITKLLLSSILAAMYDACEQSKYGHFGLGSHVINASYGSYAPDGTELTAMYEVYRHGVSFAAGRGNLGISTDHYPSSYPQSLVVSVGGSNSNKARGHYPGKWSSDYGGSVDLIAPAGCGIGVNGEDIVRTVSANLDNTVATFDGTSAATPHVSGCIALLRSFFNKQNITDLEPEDFEGILKASALDIAVGNETPPSATDYDIATGWGFLQLDKAFEMIDPSMGGTYGVVHVTVPKDNNFVLGDWSNQYVQSFSDVGFPNSLPQGNYSVKKRQVTTSFTLPSTSFNFTKPLFVWSRGKGDKYCYTDASICFQERWTDVTSGTGGIAEQPGVNKTIRGIHHDNIDRTISLKGFQYEMFKHINNEWVSQGKWPKDEDLGFMFSVFGSNPNFSTVHDTKLEQDAGLEFAFSSKGITISARDNDVSLRKISVYNVLGTEQINKVNGSDVLKSDYISFHTLNTGTHFVSVLTNKQLVVKKFVVIR